MVLSPVSGDKIQCNCETVLQCERAIWDMTGPTSIKETDLGFPEGHLQFGTGAYNPKSHGLC